MKTMKLFGLLLITALVFNACSDDEISEAEFAGTFSGTINCTLKVTGEDDVNLENVPYTITISNDVDGDGKLTLVDGGLLDGYEVSINGSKFSGSDEQTVTVLDLGDNQLNNVTFTRTTNGELDGNNLDHTFSASGTSDEGAFTFTCSGTLSK